MFYSLLKELVYTRKAICPISNPIFLELFKQKDISQRTCIAKIMDELSCGYFLESKYNLFKREIEKVIGIKSNNWVSIFELTNLFEEKIVNSYAIQHLVNEKQKPTIEILSNVLDVGDWDHFDKLIESMNSNLQTQKNLHESEISSFKLLQAIEIHNTLSAICDIFPELKDEINKLPQTPDVSDIKNKFPSIWAFGSIHAVIRYDRQRKYRLNDFFDIDHCSMAIGYYDYLFTEKSFYHVVTDSLVKLDQTFNTTCCKDYKKGNSILYSIITSA